ncbi:hypothetical protein B0H17DRAFT_1147224 [Mycena rosella]|uniref:Uncharacterized protein n=1 Tax=Mycena rosella TaxID=1033263 RepID=A0AAD7CMW5_MYCRO|nr:hypothetical protein B0H17DRAFT_1147224 [Mycena rosella]
MRQNTYFYLAPLPDGGVNTGGVARGVHWDAVKRNSSKPSPRSVRSIRAPAMFLDGCTSRSAPVPPQLALQQLRRVLSTVAQYAAFYLIYPGREQLSIGGVTRGSKRGGYRRGRTRCALGSNERLAVRLNQDCSFDSSEHYFGKGGKEIQVTRTVELLPKVVAEPEILVSGTA